MVYHHDSPVLSVQVADPHEDIDGLLAALEAWCRRQPAPKEPDPRQLTLEGT